MTGRCASCRRFTATRADGKKVGTLLAYRVGFIQEAKDGRQLSEPVLMCLPCLSNLQTANSRRSA